jgi:hypothetical protein
MLGMLGMLGMKYSSQSVHIQMSCVLQCNIVWMKYIDARPSSIKPKHRQFAENDAMNMEMNGR